MLQGIEEGAEETEKAKKATESGKLPDAAELLREEKGTDGDSEGELSEASKHVYFNI